MEIRNLEQCDFDTLFHAFERAFSDYAVQFHKEEVRSMLMRRGYAPHLSFAAYEGNDIVAFTLNGIGHHNGIPTAYDTGTGTAPEYRGRHLAADIFNRSLPVLHSAGIRQYLLEVLTDNTKAISVYSKMGFEVSRNFDCFRQLLKNVRDNSSRPSDTDIRPIGIEAVRHAQIFCDFAPSWQNSFESIERGEATLGFLGAFTSGQLTGYCVFDSMTGDLTQIAVDPEYRRKGIASELLRQAIAHLRTDFIKVLNISSDNHILKAFLESKSIFPATSQYEMIRKI